MAAINVSFTRLVCDSCGLECDSDARDATSARIEASTRGWKYTVYDIKGKKLQAYARNPGQRTRTVPRQWDCCSICPMPDVIEAAAIRDKRSGEAANVPGTDALSA